MRESEKDSGYQDCDGRPVPSLYRPLYVPAKRRLFDHARHNCPHHDPEKDSPGWELRWIEIALRR